MAMKHDVEIDTCGLLCPLPVLKARKRLSQMAKGEVLLMWADDPASVIDVPHYCAESGHVLLAQDELEQRYRYLIQRA